MTDPPPRALIRSRKIRGVPAQAESRLSRRPWAGFTAHDMARDEPLGRCPSPRCRRAKACIAALDNLYCRRTHHDLEEQKRRLAQSPLHTLLAAVPVVDDAADLAARMERIEELAMIRRAHDADMLARWKSGGLDHLHGPYRAAGVVLKPPPRVYVEGPKTRVDNGGGTR